MFEDSPLLLGNGWCQAKLRLTSGPGDNRATFVRQRHTKWNISLDNNHFFKSFRRPRVMRILSVKWGRASIVRQVRIISGPLQEHRHNAISRDITQERSISEPIHDAKFWLMRSTTSKCLALRRSWSCGFEQVLNWLYMQTVTALPC